MGPDFSSSRGFGYGIWRPGVTVQPPWPGRKMVRSSTGTYLCCVDRELFLQSERHNKARQSSIFKGSYNSTYHIHSRNRRGLTGFFKPMDSRCNGLNLTGV